MPALPCHPEATFASPEEAQAAINLFARPHGYAVVHIRMIKDHHKERRRVILGCDRHGEVRKNEPHRSKKRPNAASRRCGCPMRINVYRRRDRTAWEIRNVGEETNHNHDASEDPASHPVHQRTDMTAAVRAEITTDAQNGTRSAQTLARNVDAAPDTSIQPRDIYNARHRAEAIRVGTRSRVEHLLTILEEGPYRVAHRLDSANRLSHLFFAQNDAVDVFAQNYDVIAMDCTYKTNRFGLPLLNIIGVSGFNTTIHLAQAFIRGEAFEDYHWAVSELRTLLDESSIPLPQVILVDRDLALLNALEVVFPEVPVLLCLWHIAKDVESHARKLSFQQVYYEENSRPRKPKWKDSAAHRQFCDAFIALTKSCTEDEYEANRRTLHELSPEEAAYIDDVWLDIWKRRIVRCWTNQVVHFGMQTTSRVDGYHSALKRWLQNAREDLLTLHNRMIHWWGQTVRAHKKVVSDAGIKDVSSLRRPLYRAAVTRIHTYALLRCAAQLELLGSGQCSDMYTKTTGLPCVHTLRRTQQLQLGDFQRLLRQ